MYIYSKYVIYIVYIYVLYMYIHIVCIYKDYNQCTRPSVSCFAIVRYTILTA